MTNMSRVLFIGAIETHECVKNILLAWRPACQLFMVSGIETLFDFTALEQIRVAILHDSLSVDEIQNCAAYVRHHWSDARILLIHMRTDVLDDPLYDERIQPEASADELLDALEWMEADMHANSAKKLLDG